MMNAATQPARVVERASAESAAREPELGELVFMAPSRASARQARLVGHWRIRAGSAAFRRPHLQMRPAWCKDPGYGTPVTRRTSTAGRQPWEGGVATALGTHPT